MSTCDTCKWWGKDQQIRWRSQNTKECRHIQEDIHGAGVVAVHDGNYSSDLYTCRDFGCVHHEPKQP